MLNGMTPMRKRLLITGAALAAMLIVYITVANLVVASYGSYTSAEVAGVPVVHAALVLGTSRRLGDGRDNRFYRNRMQAAAELYRSGRCARLIVSGDNHVADYNEPADMKEDLIALGVPGEAIICDYAGRRTLDSVVRFKEIFGQDSGIVVSQRFHNERAVFIARHRGIALYGFNAEDVDAYNGFRTRVREVMSKAVAMLEVFVLHSQPRFLGERISI